MNNEQEIENLELTANKIKAEIKRNFIRKSNGQSYLINFDRKKYVESIIDEKTKSYSTLYSIKFLSKKNEIARSVLQYWETLFVE